MDIIGKTLGNILGKRKPSYNMLRSGGKAPPILEFRGSRGTLTHDQLDEKFRKNIVFENKKNRYVSHPDAPPVFFIPDYDRQTNEAKGRLGNIPVKYSYLSSTAGWSSQPALSGDEARIQVDVATPKEKREVMKKVHNWGWKGNVKYGNAAQHPHQQKLNR